MNMESPFYRIRIIPHTLYFKQPAGTSRGVYHERKVWYVIINSPYDASVIGVGECAPLPGLSCDAMDDKNYYAILRTFCNHLEQTGVLDYDELRSYPSMLFGLETALLSVKASQKKSPFCLYDNNFTRGKDSIPTNGLIWMGNFEQMQHRLDEKLAQGFQCIKIKIGAIDFDLELDLLTKLRNRYSKEVVELRVDANGAFTYDEAFQKLDRLSRYDIHSIEQPIAAGQWERMANLCSKTPLPIALDEELIGINHLSDKVNLLETIHPQYIILKPSLHGGLKGAEEWIREARTLSIPFWVTSALESNIGLNALSQWCYEVISHDRSQYNLSSVRFQGLGTGLLYHNNFSKTSLSLEGQELWFVSKKHREFEKKVSAFRKQWEDESVSIEVNTSGSTGVPKVISVEKQKMRDSAIRTCHFLKLAKGDTALLCLPVDFIAGKMMLVRAAQWSLQLIYSAPSSRPFEHLYTSPIFVAMTPMQVYETLRFSRERRLLRGVKHLIIGGGYLSEDLENSLRDFPHAVWSTYGMTETLSHIAMRRVSGPNAKKAYTPLPGVSVSLDADSCLVIEDKVLATGSLKTNDIALIHDDGSFVILGRKDNVICTGGLKFQIEDIERKLSVLPFPFHITSLPDEKYGELVTLLYVSPHHPDEVKCQCRSILSGPECPKRYFRVSELPFTETSKPARKAIKELALQLASEIN